MTDRKVYTLAYRQGKRTSENRSLIIREDEETRNITNGKATRAAAIQENETTITKRTQKLSLEKQTNTHGRFSKPITHLRKKI